MSDKTPKIIAERYEVIAEIGSGGMAMVYKAFDSSLKKHVAVKILRPEMMTEEAMMRFQLEAKTASTLLHPNLIRTLDFGITADGIPYLVMDYVDGITLSRYIRDNRRIPIERAAGIFIQICDALTLAHNQKVLHRDLKSSNVMLTQTDSPYPKAFVVDFGLAKRVEDPSMTRAGQLIGSPRYMSPEHSRGEELDNRADIYSMGCVMFETLTGTPPITGETILDTIMKQSTEEAPSLSEFCPDVEFSPQLEQLVATSLHKDPDQRFQSMEELKSSIQALREFKSAQSVTRESKSPQIESLVPDSPPLVPGPVFSKKFIIGCIVLVATIGGIGLLVAPMVPILLDLFQHAEPEAISNKPLPKATIGYDLDAEDLMLPGANTWSGMPWSDGVVWYKKWGFKDSELEDFKKFNKFAYVSLWNEKATSVRLLLLLKADLKGLSLFHCQGLNDELMKVVARMKSLEVLLLDQNPGVTDEGLKVVCSLPELKIFSMTKNRFTDEGFRDIAKLRKLEVLDLKQMPNFNGTGMKYLVKLPNLKKLKINRCTLVPGTISQIAQLKKLRFLSLEGCKIKTSEALELAKLPNVEVLDIGNTELEDAGFMALIKMKTLKKIYIGEHLHENRISQKSLDNAPKVTSAKILDATCPPVDNTLNYKF